jgi:hypothetical protein
MHCREQEFMANPVLCFESLININKKLDQYDAAMGVLKVVDKLQKKHPQLKAEYTVQEAWLAKLGWSTFEYKHIYTNTHIYVNIHTCIYIYACGYLRVVHSCLLSSVYDAFRTLGVSPG